MPTRGAPPHMRQQLWRLRCALRGSRTLRELWPCREQHRFLPLSQVPSELHLYAGTGHGGGMGVPFGGDSHLSASKQYRDTLTTISALSSLLRQLPFSLPSSLADRNALLPRVLYAANGLFKQYESGRTRHGLLHRWTFDLRNFLTIQGFVPPKRKRTRQHHNVGVEVQEEGEEVEGDGEEDTQSPL